MSSHETFMPKSIDWHTPQYVIDALPQFDLDPCCSDQQTTVTAKNMICWPENGLATDWQGAVWLNPPWGAKIIDPWMRRMASHNDGVALVPARLDVSWFHTWALPVASSMFVFRGRLTFALPYAANERLSARGNCACPCVLLSFGTRCMEWLRDANLRGAWMPLKAEIRGTKGKMLFDDG